MSGQNPPHNSDSTSDLTFFPNPAPTPALQGSYGDQCCLSLPRDAKAVHEGLGREDWPYDQPGPHSPRNLAPAGWNGHLAHHSQVSFNVSMLQMLFQRDENDIDTVWSLPVGLFLTSFGWWECFVQEQGTWSRSAAGAEGAEKAGVENDDMYTNIFKVVGH